MLNSETLYYQQDLEDSLVINNIRDDTERLTTALMREFPHCTALGSFKGCIVGCNRNQFYVSAPLMPHLFDPVIGFFQFNSDINVMACTSGGVFIATNDETFFLSAIESPTPNQSKVFDFGAVEGTAVELPDGRAAWFTRYGQAIGNSDGSVTLINNNKFAPDIAQSGAGGVVESNGNKTIITTMRGATKRSGVGIGFTATLET
jgi:hypothetical protein